jgi:hypothetical protein
MKSIPFAAEERQALAEMLDQEIPRLRDAIVQATADYAYRDALRERERLFNVIREKLGENLPPDGSVGERSEHTVIRWWRRGSPAACGNS